MSDGIGNSDEITKTEEVFIDSSKPVIENISDPHIGILSTYEEYLWGGVIDLADYPYFSDTRIIKIDPKNLDLLSVYDFSSISKYIDAFDIENEEFWVG